MQNRPTQAAANPISNDKDPSNGNPASRDTPSTNPELVSALILNSGYSAKHEGGSCYE